MEMTTNERRVNNAPMSIVVFGVTGDLSSRKLLPALFHLYSKELLPQRVKIVGFSRKDISHDEFRTYVKKVLKVRIDSSDQEKLFDTFVEIFSYVQGDFTELDSYTRLSDHLKSLDAEMGQCSNKVFHLAVPPTFYESIFENLSASGMSKSCDGDIGWTRLLVEKPFGKDSETAQSLDKKLGSLFHEEQIFRIDHYMAKESIQNILAFRFSNSLFEHVWRASSVEKVEIKLLETLGIEGRGSLYDSLGALRDVGQNHLLQMLAFVTMEDPGVLASQNIRQERLKILEALRCPEDTPVEGYAVRGQYQAYSEEKNVAEDTQTETYFRIKAFIENKRWSGVPIYIESGKRLKEKITEVSIFFRPLVSCTCPPGGEVHPRNILSFRIEPDNSIAVTFWAKKPGLGMEIEPKTLSFKYEEDQVIKNAYEKVLYDAIAGDQTLFTSTEEVSSAWKFVTPLMSAWKDAPLHIYEAGSEGPEEARRL